MTEKDENLLTWYMKGFKDELNGTTTVESDYELENVAYKLGAQHAIMGDDMRDFDYLTNEEILELIKS